MIMALIFVGSRLPVYSLPVVWFLIASRQHALGILMHEASHSNLIPHNHKFNNWISDLFLAFPGFFSTDSYRASHLLHHKNNQTDSDPTYLRKLNRPLFQFPKTRKSLFLDFVYLLLGGGFIESRRSLARVKKQNTQVHCLLVYWCAMALLLSFFSGWKVFFLFWLIPGMTFLPALSHLRTLSEHSHLEGVTELSRSVRLHPIAAFLFFPYHVNRHIEHHLFPEVKWQDLPQIEKYVEKKKVGEVVNGLSGLLVSLTQKQDQRTIKTERAPLFSNT